MRRKKKEKEIGEDRVGQEKEEEEESKNFARSCGRIDR